ncbi:biogenesis of lysosome-related organelles complex 1 subunit 1 [Selaginella moellendorffii]|uniref:biogenesis of lysosome-related organelles complex 1 subunit 1 n=2 Tax=Selaginella moellendorffii TaxID=88036 RepID=UPI000D1CEF0C|nr:biogenesis of lysosome-related organelles complex 1 subunit 1 [Selaginella moellendorffii]|eukprot:XP_024519300.1 biogenesis of lysosome-related organelles complex 1 subunit 1 [Selaginella moellendorffii]
MAAGGLDAAFLELMRDRAQRSAAIRQRIDRDRKEALASAAQVSKLLERGLNAGVQEVFANEKRIESETRAVAMTVQRAVKQSNQWMSLFHSFDTALKEIGDFENWIKIMERDCEEIQSALERVKR